MTGRSAAIKGFMAIVLAASIIPALPRTAAAQSSPWWPGDPEVILGYGCTSIELEPYDRRFSCPAQASHVHEGMDIDLPYGTSVYAGWPGVVTEIGGSEAHDYGPHAVKIWLDEGHDIVLGHLSKVTVVKGQRVEIGTLIGYVGDLGVTDIPNLDFGARPHGGGTGQSIDPSRFLSFLDRSQVSQSYAMRDPNGRIQVLARAPADGSAWSIGLNGSWAETPGGPYGGFATEPVVASDGRGRLVAFGVGVDGTLWASSQLVSLDATTRWGAWTPLGRPATAPPLVGLPAVATDPQGRMHLFVRAGDGTLWEARQSRVGGRWSRWARTPFASQVAGDPVTARDSAGALQVFAPGADGRVLVNRQAGAGGSSTGWRSLGRPSSGEAGFSGRIAVIRDGAGLLETFVVTGDGSVFTSMQSKQSKTGRWTPWTQIGWRADSSVAAVLRPDRRVQVFALNRSGFLLTSIRQGNDWSPWVTLGHGLSGGIAATIGPNASVTVVGASDAHTFVVRSGDMPAIDRRTAGPLEAEYAEAQAVAWAALPRLPRIGSLGSRVVAL
jgi:hypothetical protein